jgi:hypothetical protein
MMYSKVTKWLGFMASSSEEETLMAQYGALRTVDQGGLVR